MEKKLAEFRARRQAENAVNKEKRPGPTTADTTPLTDTSISDSQQTETENRKHQRLTSALSKEGET